ncbi:MAG: hypothetical protein QOI80_1744 [Solirubrobacteraceae bacterium]|nr:hypothetical protein [Solirubrobacteraceae bacterium]
MLPKVLHRVGPIPAVTATRDLSGPWDTPGSQRTVVLDDGSTAREEVLEWVRPERFRYRVDTFTSPLGRLVDHAIGEFRFSPSGFEWTYAFAPRNAASGVLLRPFVRFGWSRYMARCADAAVALAQAG